MKSFVFVVLLAACTPAPAPPPRGIDPDDVAASDVCKHLAELDCSEGRAANCVVTIEKVRKHRLTNLQSRCLMSKTSKEEARECRSVKCP